MVSNSAKLDCRTKQHTESGVTTSDGSRDMARTRSRRKKKEKKKEKKMNSGNPIKHPLRGSLIKITPGSSSLFFFFVGSVPIPPLSSLLTRTGDFIGVPAGVEAGVWLGVGVGADISACIASKSNILWE